MSTLELRTRDLNTLLGRLAYNYYFSIQEFRCNSWNCTIQCFSDYQREWSVIVFPTIRVCYLAGEFIRMLQKRHQDLKITDEEVLCVEIAGLCHDLGNTPVHTQSLDHN